jgi:membrane-bound serine protease (ClpP class)
MRHIYSSLFLLAAALFLGGCGTSGGGIPLYAIALPVLLALLAAVGVVLAVLRTNRSRVSTGREGMIGEVGVVRRPVTGSSAGMVFVHGELWRALPEDPDDAPLETGSEVEVVGFRRSAVVVRPTERA